MKRIPHIDRSNWLTRIDAHRADRRAHYFAMYSSVAGGIVTDPALMMVPVDDHVVHRGDGVFETLKCVANGIYNLRAHLERLMQSANGIGLTLRYSLRELEEIIVETVRAGNQSETYIRVLLSRGPGSLGVNPTDCPEPQLYVITAPLSKPFMDSHPNGARLGFSRIPPKPPPFASLKSCNYLSNALMAAEGTARGLDYIVGLDAEDHVLEGPTENVAMITKEQWLVTPSAPDILPGTTLERCIALAVPLLSDGTLKDLRRERINRTALARAQEILIMGTTHDVVAVTETEDGPVETGKPGPVFERLSRLLRDDIRTNTERRTSVR